jgi:hypothetical protein
MRRVRLTEGQLHNVIRESVSQILNELDWKTYDNAYNKKWERMENPSDPAEHYKNLWPLVNAKYDAIDRQYPHVSSALNKLISNKPLTPEEQEELDTYEKDWDNHMDRKYKYEKGGRGYYLDDED